MVKMKESWIKYLVVVGSLLLICAVNPSSAALNPSMVITDVTGEVYDSISFPVNDTITFRGEVTPDGTESVSRWEWDLVPNPTIPLLEDQEFDCKFTVAGDYSVTLTVTDQSGNTETSASVVLHITDVPNLYADFAYFVDRTSDPFTITLIDQSECSLVAEGVTSWYWILDGVVISKNQVPLKVPLPMPIRNGEHTLGLRIDTEYANKAYIEKDDIIIPPEPVEYDIDIDVSSMDAQIHYLGEEGSAPADVEYYAEVTVNEFTKEKSAAIITDWIWLTFDGTNNRWFMDEITGGSGFAFAAHGQNPIVTYDKSGLYWPLLICIIDDPVTGNSYGEFAEFPPDQIPWFDAGESWFTLGPRLSPDFYWDTFPQDQSYGHLVQFKDNSNSANGVITGWTWDFGDGETVIIPAGGDPNILHRYKEPGSYAVTLTVTDGIGDPVIVTHNVVINPGHQPNPDGEPFGFINPDFNTIGATTGFAPLTVSFADASTGAPTKWFWDFDDGNSSVEKNPVHQFHTPKPYNVTLTVSNGATTNKVMKPNFITVI